MLSTVLKFRNFHMLQGTCSISVGVPDEFAEIPPRRTWSKSHVLEWSLVLVLEIDISVSSSNLHIVRELYSGIHRGESSWFKAVSALVAQRVSDFKTSARPSCRGLACQGTNFHTCSLIVAGVVCKSSRPASLLRESLWLQWCCPSVVVHLSPVRSSSFLVVWSTSAVKLPYGQYCGISHHAWLSVYIFVWDVSVSIFDIHLQQPTERSFTCCRASAYCSFR